uniref:Uncharacterized protein n=1 Tax=Oryza sativa subsp. japonica TaxID=39947 RepID=Q69QL5_ORYSJ|nr:hypothetical protein [Oryza sativa Japonica Group]
MGSWIWADDGRIRHPASSHGVIRDDGDGGGGAKQSSMLATKRSIIDTGYEVEIKSEKKKMNGLWIAHYLVVVGREPPVATAAVLAITD